VTFVPFLPDGRCVLIERADGPALPAGEVLEGEDYLIDTVLRVPLQTAGFRYQRLRPFGLDGGHLYAWIEGAPTAVTDLTPLPCSASAPPSRPPPGSGPRSSRSQPQRSWLRPPPTAPWMTRRFTPIACAPWNDPTCAGTPQEGSGFGGDEQAWRHARHHITEAIRTTAHSWTPAPQAPGMALRAEMRGGQIASTCAFLGLGAVGAGRRRCSGGQRRGRACGLCTGFWLLFG
jgi:hypothetical protein